MPVGAIVGGSIGGALLSSNAAEDAAETQSDAANSAADAQLQAAREANALQRYMFNTGRKDIAPYRQIGTGALRQFGKAYGVGPQGQKVRPDFGQFRLSPEYNLALDEGLSALDKSAASRGGLFSGAQMKGAQRFGQSIARAGYGDYANRLASLAGIGQTGAQQSAQLGQNYANQAGANTLAAGNARASGYLGAGQAAAQGQIGAANAWTGGINNALMGYGMYKGGYFG